MSMLRLSPLHSNDPAVLLLRLPYLGRLLEAVRSGIPLEGLAEALRPASCQAHDDLATYLTELVLALFDASQLRGLQGPLEPFGALADPMTVRRALLAQMRYSMWRTLPPASLTMSTPLRGPVSNDLAQVRHPHDIAPPGESSLLIDAEAVETLQFYFLSRRARRCQLRNFTSPAQ